MRRVLLVVTLTFASLNIAMSQDIITKKNGDDIQAKVTEITETAVKYKKWSNQDGPTYTISKADVFRIKYKSGDVDMFNDATQASADNKESADNGKSKLVSKSPDARNAEIIKRYSGDHMLTEKFSEKDKQKPALMGLAIMKFDQSSVLSTEDLEMTVKLDESSHPDKTVYGAQLFGKQKKRGVYFRYDIMLTNKTDHIIYIDLANTIRWSNMGDSYSYYNTDQVSSTVGHSTASGIGLGVAGVGVGTGRSNSASLQHTYVSNQIMSIPPHATRQLSQFKYASSKKSTSLDWGAYETPERAEEFCFSEIPQGYTGVFQALCVNYRDLHLRQGFINKGCEKTFTVEDSPYVVRYNIAYSSDDSFKTYSMLTPVLYIDKIIGGNERTLNLYYWTLESSIIKNITDYDENTIIAPVSFGKNYNK